ncbi:hypothetical protein PybrP1_012431 [[Pythium] brassicae (nom. inval.)]|nr:hypothetical protein PybrP1_012431 [[Pythium] brassicae (nom. inval.)]
MPATSTSTSSGDAGAGTTAAAKDAVALAIRRRNAPLTTQQHRNTLAFAEDADVTRKLSFSGAHADDDEADAADGRVQIVIRIRPLVADGAAADSATAAATAAGSRRESGGEGAECFRVVSDTALVAQPPKTSQAYRSTGTATSFQFSRIFPAATAQRELFVATTKPVVRAAFDGKSGLVFAYGVTNSGKTYTISGTTARPGVLPRALQLVIKELTRRKENDAAPVTHVTASYLEVYNENVYDLLAAPTRKRRALRLQDCDGKIQVKGMVEKPIRTAADGDEILAVGMKNKQVAETSCNLDSSRSHCVFTLHFYHRAARGGLALRSKVSIVDLAGSERSAKTGATGLRMQEASKINGSLMNLMRCLETLRWNQQHPPALHKMLFQEHLVGKSLGPLVMIVAVNPSSHEFDDTLRTLKYSAVARELVPVQSGPAAALTRSQARKAGTTFVYDLDGRLKKRQKLSLEPTTPSALGHSMAGKSAAASLGSHRTADDALMNMQIAYHSMELRVTELEVENDELRRQLSSVNAEKLELEVQIRAEIGGQMHQQLQHIKAQYQAMAATQPRVEDEQLLSSARKAERSAAHETAALRLQVHQLQLQLNECEDEMARVRARHEQELVELRHPVKREL